jgi:hypothetical protein
MTAPARQPQGIPTGGQFAPDTRAEPTLLLTPPSAIEYKAPLTGTIDLGTAFGDLPPWPPDMGRPHVSFDFSDGKVQTYVTAEDQTMTYWDSDFNGTTNSTDTGENPWEDFEEESQEQALEWGKEVHERIDSATYGIMNEASNNERVSDLIVAYATGPEPPAGPDLADKATRDTYVIRTAAKVAKAQRELQQVYMIGPAQELREGFPDIDSFELNADGKNLEISAARDADGNPVAGDIVAAASHEVFRYRDEDDYSTYLDAQTINVGEAISFRPAG